jgi:hypothetical protein
VIALIAGEKAADVGAIAPGIVGALGKFGTAVGFGLNAQPNSAGFIGGATLRAASEAGSASCDAGGAATPTTPGGLGEKPWKLAATAGVPIDVAGPGSAADGVFGKFKPRLPGMPGGAKPNCPGDTALGGEVNPVTALIDGAGAGGAGGPNCPSALFIAAASAALPCSPNASACAGDNVLKAVATASDKSAAVAGPGAAVASAPMPPLPNGAASAVSIAVMAAFASLA